jgi:hypothetical protein
MYSSRCVENKLAINSRYDSISASIHGLGFHQPNGMICAFGGGVCLQRFAIVPRGKVVPPNQTDLFSCDILHRMYE